MKRAKSYVCANCDELFERAPKGVCPVCGSQAIYPLGRWTGGIVEPSWDVRRVDTDILRPAAGEY
jgi:DNA-directed RNA polymerase subunit RPC12/RpoP